jgi:hypothetical protein
LGIYESKNDGTKHSFRPEKKQEKNTMKKNVIVAFCLSIFACTNYGKDVKSVKHADSVAKEISIEDICDFFKNKELSEIEDEKRVFGFDLVKVDEISDEDDTLTWPVIIASYYGENIFKVETNWEDTVRFHRLTFLSSKVKTRSGLSIGAKMEKFRHFENLVLDNESPDGEIVFKDKNTHLRFIFDTSEIPELKEGVKSVSEIPDGLKVSLIVYFFE